MLGQGAQQGWIQKILVGGDFKHKTSNIRMSSSKLRVIFRPKSEIQTIFSPKIRWSPKKKKKKKKVFTIIESDFSAGFITFRLVGGDASRNGAELFEIGADFSAKIVTFRLMGGMHPPHPPPKSATGAQAPFTEAQRFVQSAFFMANFFKKYFVRNNWRGGGEFMNCY